LHIRRQRPHRATHPTTGDCGDYTDGTSGSPFLADVSAASGLGTVIGVIGGYEQGGDTPEVSYAPKFGAAVAALFQSAEAAG
jgi:hypothetical protein